MFIRYPGHFIQHSSTETGTRRQFGRRRSFGVAGYHFSFLRVAAAYSSSASVRPAFVQFTSLRFSSLLVFYSLTFFFLIFFIHFIYFRFSCVRALRSLSAFKQISSSYDTRLSSLVRSLGRDSRCRVWMVEWDGCETRMDGFPLEDRIGSRLY